MKFDDLHPKTVLAVAAHPDDIDFGASGTVAAFAAQGAAVYYLILTDGGKGSEDRSASPETLTAMRRQEQRDAGKILGLKDVFFCDYPDGTLENTLDVKREVVRIIRTVRPDVVITMDPSVLYAAERGFVNHPDHRAAGQATLDAVFPLARDHLSFPELFAAGLEPHKTGTVLLINMKDHNFAMNISETLDRKLQALAAHTSQMPDIDAIKTMVTGWAQQAGEPYGYPYAEQFMRIDIH